MSNEEKIKWFNKSLRFAVEGQVHLVMKSNKGGNPKWAVIDTEKKLVLNSNMEWEPEPPFSKDRTESFLIRTRFDFDTAASLYEQLKMFAE